LPLSGVRYFNQTFSASEVCSALIGRVRLDDWQNIVALRASKRAHSARRVFELRHKKLFYAFELSGYPKAAASWLFSMLQKAVA